MKKNIIIYGLIFDVHGCVGEAPTLEITSPVFDKTVISFPSTGKPDWTNVFEIIAKRKNAGDIYIQSAKLNEKEWDSFKFPVAGFFEEESLKLNWGRNQIKKGNQRWF